MPKKPAPKADPKPDLIYVPEGELPKLFLLHDSDGHWRALTPGGYTDSIVAAAGTFTQAQADEIEANAGDTAVPLERAVQDAMRAANPVVLAAIAALGGR